MNLEELVSKYLDGELTQIEDETLRSRLSEDKSARHKFDASVNLHLAYKEDAESINPPLDLVEKTEDMILMKIFGKAPDLVQRKSFAFSRLPVFASLIIAFFLVFIFEISDVSMMYENNAIVSAKNEIISTETAIVSNNLPDESIINNKIQKSNKQLTSLITENNIVADESDNFAEIELLSASGSKTAGASMVSDEYNMQTFASSVALKNSENEYIADNVFLPEALSSIPIFSDIDDSELFDAKVVGSVEANDYFPIDYIAAMSVNNPNVSIEIGFDELSQNYDIQVASFFGTDVIRGGIDASNSVLSHFSQSVAYSIDENARLGIEVGYTEYTYNDDLPNNSNGKSGQNVSGIESYEAGFNFPNKFNYPTNVKNTKQLFWASAFYESNILSGSDITLSWRLGGGASSEGPLGYGRVFALYQVFNGFYFTLGTEGRLFVSEVPEFVNEDEGSLKASAMLIYGFQFIF